MKIRLLAFALVMVMLLSSACAALPSELISANDDAYGIISSDEAVQTNTTSSASSINVVATDKVSVRGGTWANKTWRQIMTERTNSGQISGDMIVIKNGLSNGDYTRVGLFRYDISNISADAIGYATFVMNPSEKQGNVDVFYDVYWVEDNWDAATVTWNTKPAFVDSTPIMIDVLAGDVEKYDATSVIKRLVASGKKTVSLMVVQTTSTEAETRFKLTKSTDLTFPHFVVYKDEGVKDSVYIKQLVDDEAQNQAIWDHAKKMYDEWYADYVRLKDTPLYEAEPIVSDESQYNKTSYTYSPSNPTKVNKEHKTRTYGDLTDMAKYVDVNADVEYDRYGGIIDDQMRQEATGFYYTTKIGDRWWIIDPIGYPCYIRALSGITYSYQNSPKQKEAATLKFGNYDKWAISTTRHLIDDLYFNAGAGPDGTVKKVEQGIAWQGGTSFMSSYGTKIGINNSNGGSTTFSENNTMPVWDPDFVTFCDERAAANVPQWVDDPMFLGYTTDNELPMQKGMIYDYMNISPARSVNYYSYACTWYWVVQMTGKENPTNDDITEELEQLFRGFVWRKYYEVVCGAVRKYDQNHMILGTRFLTAVKDAPWVLRFAGEYLDCITINWYSAWEPQAENIYLFATNANVPFMVTEFYAKAEENEDGLKNTSGAGFYVKTQQDRADHYQSFTLRLLEAKNCVGWHWFQYSDNDPTGNPTDVSSTDANKGIVSNTHTEYTDLTDDMKDINKNVYTLIKYFDAKYAK